MSNCSLTARIKSSDFMVNLILRPSVCFARPLVLYLRLHIEIASGRKWTWQIFFVISKLCSLFTFWYWYRYIVQQSPTINLFYGWIELMDNIWNIGLTAWHTLYSNDIYRIINKLRLGDISRYICSSGLVSYTALRVFGMKHVVWALNINDEPS